MELELQWSRRAFPKAQELLAGSPTSDAPLRLDVGWHSNDVEAEAGAIAVVRDGAGLDAWLGQVLRVTSLDHPDRAVFVFVLGARGVPTDLSLSRRAFLALGVLSLESLSCLVEVME